MVYREPMIVVLNVPARNDRRAIAVATQGNGALCSDASEMAKESPLVPGAVQGCEEVYDRARAVLNPSEPGLLRAREKANCLSV